MAEKDGQVAGQRRLANGQLSNMDVQAIATAKRLGAMVEGYDVRPEVKEQVESVGGKVEAFYYAFGETDLYAALAAEDDVEIAAAVDGGDAFFAEAAKRPPTRQVRVLPERPGQGTVQLVG